MAQGFTVEIKPDERKIMVALKGFNQEALDRLYFRLVEGANRIRNKMINLMVRTPKSGRRYKRGKKWHIASSGGNAPAVDKGRLWNSFVINEGIDTVEVGTKVEYAKWLEEGTPKMLPRPFLAPAARAEVPRMQRKILADLERMKL
jgi:hypothetical protein